MLYVIYLRCICIDAMNYKREKQERENNYQNVYYIYEWSACYLRAHINDLNKICEKKYPKRTIGYSKLLKLQQMRNFSNQQTYRSFKSVKKIFF